MLLTLTSTAPDASDLGFLLHKHPDRVQQVELPGAAASIFYPEATPERCTVALLLDVDPVALVRGRGGQSPQDGGFALGQYVNDRPYAAASLLAVALGKAFKTALNGRCDARPALVEQALPLTVRVVAMPAKASPRGGASGTDEKGMPLVRRLFEPLGWQVDGTGTPLASGLSLEWGEAPYLDVELSGVHRLADALSHLYVLLPALDDAKHYWVGPDEVDKLLRRGEGWLPGHPERELIARRYVGVRRDYVDDALARLSKLGQEASGEVVEDETADRAEPEGPRATLRQRRLEAVLAALREVGARRVVDLGCGEGHYLRALLADTSFTEVVGVDVSARELERAERRPGLDRMPDQVRGRLSLRQSSVTYRDDAITGFDAVLLVEVVEHLDPDRVPALVTNVFGHAQPGSVVLTTPNAEHNVRYGIPEGRFRHPDHRFEWTRAELRSWAEQVAAEHGYRLELRPVGDEDPEVGPPTQLTLFTREEQP